MLEITVNVTHVFGEMRRFNAQVLLKGEMISVEKIKEAFVRHYHINTEICELTMKLYVNDESGTPVVQALEDQQLIHETRPPTYMKNYKAKGYHYELNMENVNADVVFVDGVHTIDTSSPVVGNEERDARGDARGDALKAHFQRNRNRYTFGWLLLPVIGMPLAALTFIATRWNDPHWQGIGNKSLLIFLGVAALLLTLLPFADLIFKGFGLGGALLPFLPHVLTKIINFIAKGIGKIFGLGSGQAFSQISAKSLAINVPVTTGFLLSRLNGLDCHLPRQQQVRQSLSHLSGEIERVYTRGYQSPENKEDNDLLMLSDDDDDHDTESLASNHCCRWPFGGGKRG